MNIQEKRIGLHDYGLFVCFYSARHGKDQQLVQELTSSEGILTTYRKNLVEAITLYNAVNGKDEQLHKWIYLPHIFALWGAFDVAILTLVDDFEVATRLGNCRNATSLQFLAHAIPNVSHVRQDIGALIRDPRDFYTSENDEYKQYPIIGFVLIKLNALVRIAFGNTLLHHAIEQIIRCCDCMEADGGFRLLILRSLGWNELTLLIHAKTLGHLAALIELVRASKIGDLEMDPQLLNSQHASIRAFYQDVADLKNGHLCATTRTVCGQLWENYTSARSMKDTCPIMPAVSDQKDCVRALYSVTCKPGHHNEVLDRINSLTEEWRWIHFGKTDMSSDIFTGSLNTAGFVERYAHVTGRLLDRRDQVGWHTYHSTTEIATRILTTHLNDRGRSLLSRRVEHGDVYSKLERLNLTETIKTMREQIIKHLLLPKALVTELLHVSSMLHMCLTDPLVFDLFLDFLPFFKTTLKLPSDKRSKSDWTPDERSRVCRRLQVLVDNVGHAIRSRYATTYATVEVTDQAIEFKGAYQDLLCVVSGFLHATLEYLDAPIVWALPFLQGIESPECFSLPAPAIRMSHFDLIQPEGLFQLIHELGHSQLGRNDIAADLTALADLLKRKEDEHVKSEASLPQMIERRERAGTRQGMPAEIICDLYLFYLGCAADWELFSNVFWLSHGRSGKYTLESDDTRVWHCARFFVVLFLSDAIPEDITDDWVCKRLRDWSTKIPLPLLSPLFAPGAIFGSPHNATPREDLVSSIRGLLLCLQTLKTLQGTVASLKDLNQQVCNSAIVLDNGLADIDDPIANFAFCRGILHRYCRLLWKGGSDETVKWIDRDEEGKPAISRGQSDFLVDLRGGTFVVNPQKRRKYFKARMQLFCSLLDFAHRKRRTIIQKALAGTL